MSQQRIFATHLFRACAFIAHPDGRNRTPLHELQTSEVEKAWKQTQRAVNSSLDLLAAELGIADMSILWSGSLLVPVIALCGLRPGGRNDREIAGWVAAAALCRRFSRSTATTLEQDLKACRSADPIGALLKNLKQRRAYLSATEEDFSGSIADRSGLLTTYVACRQLDAMDLLTGRRMSSNARIDRHHIFPRSVFPVGSERQRADILANIAFVVNDSNKSISDNNPSVYLKRIDERVLRSQAIPIDPALWSLDRAGEFWTQRKRLLAQAFNDYLTSVLPNRRVHANGAADAANA